MLRLITAVVLLMTMIVATATQSAALGFCLDRAEFFSGQHDSREHTCGHGSGHHEEHHECGELPEPCDDEHVEIRIDLDDFHHSGKSVQVDAPNFAFLPTLSGARQSFLRPSARLTPVRLSQPPPDVPVYLRFGVMRL